MKPRGQFIPLSLCAAFIAACRSEPMGPTRSLHPAFDAIAASQLVGPVTIQTAIDFSTFPFHGTFTVVQGAAALGCSGGTFADQPADPVFDPLSPARPSIRKTLTCAGIRTGSFTANFQGTPAPGPGDANGHWNIVAGTGDFANLRGQGDFSVVFSGVETLTGEVHFDP
jgi:uncharacterized Zn-binding protein involved in type VI secretion